MRSTRLRIVKSKMNTLTEVRAEVYAKNRGEIDEQINQIVLSICGTQPVNPENLSKSIHRIIDTFFYKRPSSKVIMFLENIMCYPPEVLYEAFMSYGSWLVGAGPKTKSSPKYFMAFVKRGFFDYKESKRTVIKTNLAEGIPDDM